jgi:multidrug efflux pump subunit AcrA (membrane-fusion protein)
MSQQPALLLALFLFLSLALPGASAADAVLPFTLEQRRALAIVSQPLAALAASGARRLPAQVKIPPARIEVITAPLGGTVTGVKVGYGDTVKKGQPLVQLQGTPLLEAQRDYAINASPFHQHRLFVTRVRTLRHGIRLAGQRRLGAMDVSSVGSVAAVHEP